MRFDRHGRALARDARTWERLARADPMWSVCTLPDRQGGRWDAEEFFATGERDVAAVFGFLADSGLEVPRGAALDFGCGLGRLTRALASRFETAVGVDVSPAMVAGARAHNGHLENCRFAVNDAPDLRMFDDGAFDFALSLAVLQHVSSAGAIRGFIAELVRVTRPGGLVVFQLPAAVARRVRLRRDAARLVPGALLVRVPALQPYAMQLTAVPEAAVAETVARAGGHVARSVEDHRVGSDAVRSVAYCVRAG